MNTVANVIEVRQRALYATVLVVGVVLGAIGSAVLAQDGEAAEPVAAQELLRTRVDSRDGPKTVWVRRVELAPDVEMASEPEIEHPAQEFVYVLDGTATLTRRGDAPVEFVAGDAWRNDHEQAHTLKNGDAAEPLALISVWIGDEGAF